jgi:hypothetical protein
MHRSVGPDSLILHQLTINVSAANEAWGKRSMESKDAVSKDSDSLSSLRYRLRDMGNEDFFHRKR